MKLGTSLAFLYVSLSVLYKYYYVVHTAYDDFKLHRNLNLLAKALDRMTANCRLSKVTVNNTQAIIHATGCFHNVPRPELRANRL